MEDVTLTQAIILVQRLARLSADSVWAHRASGLRASLDKFLANFDPEDYDEKKLGALVQQGFEVLEKAAQEIPFPDDMKSSRQDPC
jgi:hypothetical protein